MSNKKPITPGELNQLAKEYAVQSTQSAEQLINKCKNFGVEQCSTDTVRKFFGICVRGGILLVGSALSISPNIDNTVDVIYNRMLADIEPVPPIKGPTGPAAFRSTPIKERIKPLPPKIMLQTPNGVYPLHDEIEPPKTPTIAKNPISWGRSAEVSRKNLEDALNNCVPVKKTPTLKEWTNHYQNPEHFFNTIIDTIAKEFSIDRALLMEPFSEEYVEAKKTDFSKALTNSRPAKWPDAKKREPSELEYCEPCPYLSLTEEDQQLLNKRGSNRPHRHRCNKYDVFLTHGAHHPLIPKCEQCMVDSKCRTAGIHSIDLGAVKRLMEDGEL